ncbi:MAG: lysophospholipid acyltransferase family protein [Candidatus Gastranaerophilales bacterium]|nr:lysophospholipid acyltransferase family protein [Candidatus Gastranaerophilales bacterium]
MARVKKRKFKEKLMLFVLINLLKTFFFFQKFVTTIKTVNYPEGQFILSMWHCHQCVVYAVKDKENFRVLISASNDGEIIAEGALSLGIKSVRGSSKRHGTSAALGLIDNLKEGGSIGIMVDGPKGPKRKVKDGIINIAKLSGIPIIPVSWQSKCKTFFKFNTWDEFQIPFGPCKTVALFGKPIYIPNDATKEDMQEWCIKLEEEMNKVEKDLEENYESYLKQ